MAFKMLEWILIRAQDAFKFTSFSSISKFMLCGLVDYLKFYFTWFFTLYKMPKLDDPIGNLNQLCTPLLDLWAPFHMLHLWPDHLKFDMVLIMQLGAHMIYSKLIGWHSLSIPTFQVGGVAWIMDLLPCPLLNPL